MKKQLLCLFLFCSFLSFSQSISITSVVESDCGSTQLDYVRVIELYVDGTLDVSNYRIQLQFSGSSWTSPASFSGTYTDQFLYVIGDSVENFKTEFPQVEDAFINSGATGTFTNGMRAVRIIDTSNQNEVIDIYGVDGEDGNGASWEFTNSYAKRINGTSASSTFIPSDWAIEPVNTLTGLGSCNNQAILNETVNLGSFESEAANLDVQALTAIYNALDGANWSNPWDLSQSIDTFEGVGLDQSGRVTTLNLQNRGVNGVLPDEVADLDKLVNLNISSEANLTGGIPTRIKDLRNLSSLQIRFSGITECLDLSEGFPALNTLVLEVNNNLANCDFNEIPINLRGLNFLNLRKSGFVGELNNNITNLELLQTVILSQNDITGSIPESLFSLDFINSIAISSTLIAGEIPDNIPVNERLTALDISANKLSGQIPGSIANLTNLTSLNLSSNSLTGSIPEAIGSLIKLNSFNARFNKLSGPLPQSISSMQELKNIDLFFNSISGPLPETIGNLSKLEVLNMRNNNLSGVLPESIGDLSFLKYLRLSNNDIEGFIPSSLESLNNLIELDISGNSLTGQVPDLTNTSTLNTLRINFNNFVFEDFEDQFDAYKQNLNTFSYSSQASIDTEEIITYSEGSEIILTVDATQSQNNSYQWFKDEQIISGANGRELVLTDANSDNTGVYYCEITNSVVTDLKLTRKTITVNATLSNGDVDQDLFSLLPNPAADKFTIVSNTAAQDDNLLILYSISGQELLTRKMTSSQETMDITPLSSGIYILKVVNSLGTLNYKLIKE